MCRKLMCLFVVALLSLTSAGWATIWQGDVSQDWSVGANWDTGLVPGSGDTASVNNALGTGPEPPAIISTDVGTVNEVHVSNTGWSVQTLIVDGGSIAINNSLVLGYHQGFPDQGNLEMKGGSITADYLQVGYYGTGYVDMTGGTISVWGVLIGGATATSVGHVDLHGGLLEVRGYFFWMGDTPGSTASMDITEGTLIMEGPMSSTIAQYVSNGWITAYGTGDPKVSHPRATVNIDYGITNPGKTTVTATMEPVLELAWNPEPGDEARITEMTPTLSWSPGDDAVSHDVYFGTDFNEVNDADNSLPVGISVYKGNQAFEADSYYPGTLEFGTYYWRIDEVGGSNTWKGNVWSFKRTANLPTIYNLRDIPNVQRFDLCHIAVCIQGLVNRQAPRILITWANRSWLDQLMEPGGLCEDWRVYNVSSVYELFSIFSDYINGVVLYDPDPDTGVISTSLVATTVAGVEGAIAVRKDITSGSLYNYLVNDLDGPQLPVLFDLTNKFTGLGTIWQTSTPSTGSARCDAYIWAKEKYIDTGKCNPNFLSLTMDLRGFKPELADGLSNLDHSVSKKAFCFHLSPWGDEAPIDDPGQPIGTDLDTFKKILDACNAQTGQNTMIQVAGFPLHTTTSHGEGWQTEWECVKVLSAYNAYLNAEFVIANTSFYSALAPAVAQRRYVQNPAPTYDDMVARGIIDGSDDVVPGNYIMIANGDYDGATWLLDEMAHSTGLYADPVRGQVYCNWGVNPNLINEASVAIDYLYRHKTEKDYFIGWDSGAGYINPSQLHGTRVPSGYSSGVSIWQEHCRKYYRLLDYSISGWLLNGWLGSTTLTDFINYAPFSGDGIGTWTTYNNPQLVNNVPVMDMPSNGYHETGIINEPTGVNFEWTRVVLWSPSDIRDLEALWANSGNNHWFLDAYTFYYLARYYLGGNNNYRATWVSDTIPRIMAAGQVYPITVTVRNDGWDSWSEAACYRLAYAIVPEGNVPSCSDYDINGRFLITGTVAPGQSCVFDVNIIAPSTNGDYDLYYDMVRDGVTWFSGQNNIEWKKEIIVATNETDIDTDGDGVPDVVEEQNGTLYWHEFSRVAIEIYVDDDAANDPGPGDSSVSDPAEDGTVDHPYDTIQEAINFAWPSGDTVIVYPGTYSENINLGGKNIVLTSTDPNDMSVVAVTIIDGGDIGRVVTFAGTETSSCMLSGFTITNGHIFTANGGGIFGGNCTATISRCVIENNVANYGGGIATCDGRIENCLVYGNYATNLGGGIHNSDGDVVNCTVVDNSAASDAGGITYCDGTVTNCIVWNNSPAELYNNLAAFTYSCFAGGTGTNIDVNPAFVNAAGSDYHLMIDSLCINAGDPISDWSNELFPNGSRVNMGAYGNTTAATRKANFNDLAILASQWLQSLGTPSADIAPEPNGDGTVNFLDFAVFAEYWCP